MPQSISLYTPLLIFLVFGLLPGAVIPVFANPNSQTNTLLNSGSLEAFADIQSIQ